MPAYVISEVEILDEASGRLREWYASAEYAEALAIRRNALTRRLLFVEGVLDDG